MRTFYRSPGGLSTGIVVWIAESGVDRGPSPLDDFDF